MKTQPSISSQIIFHPLLPFISPSSPLFFIFLIQLSSFSMSSTFACRYILPLFSVLFWQLNDKEDEEEEEGERWGGEGRGEKLLLQSGARMMSWGHLSSWCGGFPSPANYLVQTRIWYGGYEAQIQLLWANKEILRFREWGRDCKWDRRRGTRMAVRAHTRAATARTHTRSHIHPHTRKHNHLSFPSIPSDRLMLLLG